MAKGWNGVPITDSPHRLLQVVSTIFNHRRPTNFCFDGGFALHAPLLIQLPCLYFMQIPVLSEEGDSPSASRSELELGFMIDPTLGAHSMDE